MVSTKSVVTCKCKYKIEALVLVEKFMSTPVFVLGPDSECETRPPLASPGVTRPFYAKRPGTEAADLAALAPVPTQAASSTVRTRLRHWDAKVNSGRRGRHCGSG